jgi:hypothetical protein
VVVRSTLEYSTYGRRVVGVGRDESAGEREREKEMLREEDNFCRFHRSRLKT